MSPTDEPGATLVLSSYNHSLYIREALESVAAQDYGNLSLIVTDDASADDSVRVIEHALSDLGLDAKTHFQTRNKGICATFNSALAAVETPYVAFLGADDLMHPSRFSRQVKALSAEPDAALLYGDLWVDGFTGEPPERYSTWWGDSWRGGRHENLFKNLADFNWIPAPTVLSRTESLLEVGGYDESLAYEDHDMWLRLARNHSFAYLEEPLATWRRVPNSLSAQLDQRSQEERYFSDVCMLGKHIGTDPLIDSWLIPRVFHQAVTIYKAGNRSPKIAWALRRCLRAHPSVPAMRYALTATLRASRTTA